MTDPIISLFTKVIGVMDMNRDITFGQFVKYNDEGIWLQKRNGDIVMVRQSNIDRVWITNECMSVDRQ